MALVCGLQNIKLPFVIPITTPQASGLWAGNNTVFSRVNRGTYILNWNPRVAPTNALNQITQFQMSIASVAPVGQPGSIYLATSPLCGLIGQQPGNAVTWALTNVFTITDDNTPIYVYLNIVVANTAPPNQWYMGISNDIPNLDDIDITKIA